MLKQAGDANYPARPFENGPRLRSQSFVMDLFFHYRLLGIFFSTD